MGEATGGNRGEVSLGVFNKIWDEEIVETWGFDMGFSTYGMMEVSKSELQKGKER